MPVSAEFEGAAQLAKVTRALKQLGQTAMAKEINKSITKSLAPIKENMTDHVAETLPKRGGLAKRAAKSKLPHRTRKSGSGASVRLEVKPSVRTLRDPLRVDRGRIKRPVFGMAASRAPWQLQNVKPGAFSEPFDEGAPLIRQGLVEMLDEVSDGIADLL